MRGTIAGGTEGGAVGELPGLAPLGGTVVGVVLAQGSRTVIDHKLENVAHAKRFETLVDLVVTERCRDGAQIECGHGVLLSPRLYL